MRIALALALLLTGCAQTVAVFPKRLGSRPPPQPVLLKAPSLQPDLSNLANPALIRGLS